MDGFSWQAILQQQKENGRMLIVLYTNIQNNKHHLSSLIMDLHRSSAPSSASSESTIQTCCRLRNATVDSIDCVDPKVYQAVTEPLATTIGAGIFEAKTMKTCRNFTITWGAP